MKERRNWKGWPGRGALAAALGVMGCDAQVGTEYRGEPLFSVHGSVVLSGGTGEGGVPVIAFPTSQDIVLVEGLVSGEFPARFRLDVLDPPPAEVLQEAEGVRGRYAIGVLAVASRDHGERVPRFVPSSEETCNDDGACVRQLEKCTEHGRCYTRTFSCTEEECDVVYESGDPNIEHDWETSEGSAYSGQTAALTVVEYCNANGCRRTLRSCDLSDESAIYSVSTEGLLRCELVAEAFDTQIAGADVLERVAKAYQLLYFTEAQDVPGYGHVARGYNLMERVQPAQADWIREVNCRLDSHIAAVAAYNSAHGTDYLPHGVSEAAAAEVGTHAAALDRECSVVEPWRLIRDPSRVNLTFVIGQRIDAL